MEPKWSELWKRERSLDKDIIPILADIKFRLQHNGLNVRSKYQHQTTDVLCVHGCGVLETAQHLFWDCAVAKTTWDAFLPTYRPLLQEELTWEAAVYTMNLVFTPYAMERFKTHNLLRVFNVLRCSVLYILWLHYNDCMLNGTPTNALYTVQRAKAYITLHFNRMKEQDNTKLTALCCQWLNTTSSQLDNSV